jgi:hypothetical protein
MGDTTDPGRATWRDVVAASRDAAEAQRLTTEALVNAEVGIKANGAKLDALQAEVRRLGDSCAKCAETRAAEVAERAAIRRGAWDIVAPLLRQWLPVLVAALVGAAVAWLGGGALQTPAVSPPVPEPATVQP